MEEEGATVHWSTPSMIGWTYYEGCTIEGAKRAHLKDWPNDKIDRVHRGAFEIIIK